MSWTQADLDAIETAIKSGSSRVQYADRSVMYRGLDELIRIRDLIIRNLNPAPSTPTHAYASFNKGLR